MTRTNHDERWSIIHAFNQLGSVRAAADQVGVSQRTASRWIKRWKSTNSVDDAHRTGRPTLMSEAAADVALQLLTGGDATSADQAAVMLSSQGITSKKISRYTLARGVHKAAKRQGKKVRVVRGAPRKALTQATISKRLAFCQANKRTNWKKILFTDRKKFLFKYPGTKVTNVRWEEHGQPTGVYAPNHPQVLNVYAGISYYGVTKCHVVAGSSKHKTKFTNKKGAMAKNITSQEYEDVLNTTLLHEGSVMFSTHEVGSWMLQQDNDPSHKEAAAVIQKWNNKKKSLVQLLSGWPPNSPDLNPIENLWGVVQRAVDAVGCKTFDEFKHTVLQEVKAHGTRMARALVLSMAKRVDACLEGNGCKTKY